MNKLKIALLSLLITFTCNAYAKSSTPAVSTTEVRTELLDLNHYTLQFIDWVYNIGDSTSGHVSKMKEASDKIINLVKNQFNVVRIINITYSTVDSNVVVTVTFEVK